MACTLGAGMAWDWGHAWTHLSENLMIDWGGGRLSTLVLRVLLLKFQQLSIILQNQKNLTMHTLASIVHFNMHVHSEAGCYLLLSTHEWCLLVERTREIGKKTPAGSRIFFPVDLFLTFSQPINIMHVHCIDGLHMSVCKLYTSSLSLTTSVCLSLSRSVSCFCSCLTSPFLSWMVRCNTSSSRLTTYRKSTNTIVSFPGSSSVTNSMWQGRRSLGMRISALLWRHTLLIGSILYLWDLLFVSFMHYLQVVKSLCHLQLVFLRRKRTLQVWVP